MTQSPTSSLLYARSRHFSDGLFHPLKGFNPTRFTVHVNGPWCITFEFDNGDAANVDFEQYH